MAFISGFRSRSGVLTNEVWSFANTNVDSLGWRQSPGWQGNAGNCSIGSGYMGNEAGDMLNAVLIPIDPLAVGGGISNVLYASFDIEGHQDFKRELRFLVSSIFSQTGPDRYDGSYVVRPYLRIYTDATTYTDTALGTSPQSVQIHRNDGSGVYERTTGIVFANVTYSGHHYVLLGAAVAQDQAGTIKYLEEFTYYDYNTFFQTLGGYPEEGTYSPEFGPASEPEGYSGYNYDDHSDPIDMPTAPQSILSLGFVNVYKCDTNALTDFGRALFPEITFPQSLSDVGEVLAAVSDSLWNAKLIDYVISVHCVPGNVTAGALEDIKVGARTMTGILARKITSEYVDVDFGSIETDQLFKNFADYMCSCELYLPFYGFVSLKPEEWNGGKISVKYRFNAIDGSFTAFVFASSNKSKLKDSLIGEYGGSCVVHLPVSNLSYASMFSGMIGGGAAAAMGMASGGAGMVAGALTASNAVISGAAGGDVKKSNSYNASSSFMTRRKPYLIISAPVPSFSERYAIENGLPSNVVYTLSQCKGYTVVDNPILNGIPCTAAEMERIRNLLKSGVVIK